MASKFACLLVVGAVLLLCLANEEVNGCSCRREIKTFACADNVIFIAKKSEYQIIEANNEHICGTERIMIFQKDIKEVVSGADQLDKSKGIELVPGMVGTSCQMNSLKFADEYMISGKVVPQVEDKNNLNTQPVKVEVASCMSLFEPVDRKWLEEIVEMKNSGSCPEMKPTVEKCGPGKDDDYFATANGFACMGQCSPKVLECPPQIKEVKSINGETYPNRCLMNRDQCLAGRKPQVEPLPHTEPKPKVPATETKPKESESLYGHFLSPIHDSLRRLVRAFGFYFAKFDQPKHIQADKPCTRDYRPVCGSNGKTYGNKCVFDNAARKDSALRLLHDGPCEQRKRRVRSPGAKSRRIKGPGDGCLMKPCPKIYRPVCADNGVTYSNKCEFENAVCQQKWDLKLVSNTACEEKERKREDEFKSAPSKCLRPCPLIYAPICASNDVTYPNECAMGGAACELNRKLTVKHKGECVKKCNEIMCTEQYAPVCGSDGKTYSNMCFLKAEQCSKSDIRYAYAGECREELIDALRKVVVCPTEMIKIYMPVCGDNGIEYGNDASLNIAVCHSKNRHSEGMKKICDNFHSLTRSLFFVAKEEYPESVPVTKEAPCPVN
eukprot:Nk52_evm20s232 gene=Nk52_evmTU20s232